MKQSFPSALCGLIMIAVCAACTLNPTLPPGSTPSPAQAPTPTKFIYDPGEAPVVISEVVAGIQGNNNYEYIELYNRSNEAVDLHGWALWYRLSSSPEDLFVFRWQEKALIPPQGHYLLGRSGTSLSVPADVEFSQGLNTTGGGLQLRQTNGEIIDNVGWGKAPDGYFENEPSPALENGFALERLPGTDQGNWQDTGSNAVDFRLTDKLEPQNTSSAITPFIQQRLEINLSMPDESIPGDDFKAILSVRNLTGTNLNNVQAVLPVPAGLGFEGSSAGNYPENGILTWKIGNMADGSEAVLTLNFLAPWTYYTAVAANYFAEADNWPVTAYGGVVRTMIAGGSIPIATARSLQNAELTIEGTAIMYTGGYFAGTGNTKFYLQDETGAIQVQVFGGAGIVNVQIGDRVQVRGKVSTYRDSVQIVPLVVPDDIKVLPATGEEAPTANLVPILKATGDRGLLPGSLVAIEGTVSRVDEFSYSYEIDVQDSNFQTLTLYVDKQTNIDVEKIVPGMQVFATGVLDTRDGVNLLYPRIQADILEQFPPNLHVIVEAPPNVASNGVLELTLEATNHTETVQNNVVINLTKPLGRQFEILQGSGVQETDTELIWTISSLAANGGQSSVRLSYVNEQESGQITFQPTIRSDSEANGIVNAKTIFVGDSVPIWAIQGKTYRSPFVSQVLTTEGIVTGIFPGLGGFFIQSRSYDNDPETSEGLFIRCPLKDEANLIVSLQIGDLVMVTGKIREPGQQTTLEINGASDVEVLGNDLVAITPFLLDPPKSSAEARTYYESLEGTLVTVPGPATAVSPISKYGETVIVLSSHGVDRLFQGEDNGILIMLDDGLNITYTSAEELPYIVNSGDSLSGISGPLAYTYAMYKIEPISPPKVSSKNVVLPFLPPSSADTFSVMTWNVENLFDAREPNPADPPLPNPREYRRALDKVAATIDGAGAPTIVGLQEVENISVLESLAAHEWLVEYNYVPVLLEGTDSRGIDVGFLVRADRAQIVDIQQRDAPGGVFSRPPLQLSINITTSTGLKRITLLNNHFTSMSGGELATEPRRTAQAEWNAGLVDDLIQNGETYVIVMGDLNSYFESPPITALRSVGLQHVLDSLPKEERYTYIYQGESQVLDHILVSPSLFTVLQDVVIFHVNADYALPSIDDNGVLHKSDHDPIIATFMLK